MNNKYNLEERNKMLLNYNKNKFEKSTVINKYGTEIELIEYNGYSNVIVKLKDGHDTIIKSNLNSFKNAKIISPYDKTVRGIGYIGVGDAKLRDENNKQTKEYALWFNMISRCTGNSNKAKFYKNVICCKEWLCYQNFWNWITKQDNYDVWKNNYKNFALDKDIIKKGNKIYSPSTCLLVPANVNILFTNRKNNRGKYLIGINYKNKDKYVCYLNVEKKRVYLGEYKSQIEAFYAYKEAKEKRICDVAKKEYKNKNITYKCYESMINYNIEMFD